MAAYLSKDEELELGVLIQKALKAKELREASAEAESFEIDGEAIPANELSLIIKSGDKAIEKLLEHNTALVWSRARTFKAKHPNGSPDLDDLVQEGYLGLLRAANKYDPKRGNKFSTVAYYWIDQAIARSVSKTGRLIRLPENREQDFFNIMKIRSLYAESDLNSKEIDEIAMDELKLSQKDFNNILQAAALPTSLSRRVGGESDSKELIDYIADTETEDSSEAIAMREGLRGLLFDKLQTLTDLEREVVVASFLIEDTTTKRGSVKELRDIHNLTPQKFKKVLNVALGKLKTELEGLDITFADFLD